jgi:hypothetical protein
MEERYTASPQTGFTKTAAAHQATGPVLFIIRCLSAASRF